MQNCSCQNPIVPPPFRGGLLSSAKTFRVPYKNKLIKIKLNTGPHVMADRVVKEKVHVSEERMGRGVAFARKVIPIFFKKKNI